MLFVEDLVEGQQFQLGEYTITEAEILQFANQYHPVSIHKQLPLARSEA